MRRAALVALLLLGCGGAASPGTTTPAAVSPCRAASKQSPPPATAPPSLATLDAALENLSITAVAVSGNRTMSADKIRAVSGLSVGGAYHRTAIAKAIVGLYRSGELDDVQVRATPTDGGVALELLVRERPFVEGIYAPGATPEETTALANRLGLAEGRRLDIAELRLRMGESDAPNVEYEIIPKRDNKTDVCIYRK